ncbi:MAG: CHAT domain-containing protein [Chloroflexota bacterium]
MAQYHSLIFKIVVNAVPQTPGTYSVSYLVSDLTGQAYPQIQVSSPSHHFSWPLTDRDYQPILNELSKPNARPKSADINALGEALYQLVLPDQLPIANDLAQIRGQVEQVRLSLEINPVELRKLPWEAMYHGSQLVVAQVEMPIVRTGNKSVRQYKPIWGQLNVLLLAASPIGKTHLDISQITGQVRQLVEMQHPRWQLFSRYVSLHVVLNATEQDLNTELSRHNLLGRSKYHVLCFVGHGDENAIYLDDGHGPTVKEVKQPGEQFPLAASDLIARLKSRDIRLVFFLACKTGLIQKDTQAVALAHLLTVDSEIPAVIAMQTEIGPGNAERFAVDFFREIANHRPVDTAVALARSNLIRNGSAVRDTIAPILYLQTDRADLFREQFNFLRWSIIALILMGLVTIYMARSGFVNDQIQTRNSTIRVQRELESQLQIAAQSGRVKQTLVQENPQIPVLWSDSLWVSNKGNGTVQRFTLGGVLQATIEVGSEPLPPVIGNGYLWVSNRSAGTVTRIDPAKNETQTISVGKTPELPFVVEHTIWIQSLVDWTLTRIDPVRGEVTGKISVDPNARAAFHSEKYIWVITDNDLMRIEAETLETAHFQFGTEITDGLFGNGKVWLVVDGNNLFEINPQTGDVEETKQIETPVSLKEEDGRIWALETKGSHFFELDIKSPNILHTYNAQGQPRRVFAVHNRLWVVRDDDRLIAIESANGQIINQIELPGASSLNRIVSDGEEIWLTVRDNGDGEVIQIDQESGKVFRTLTPCNRPDGPVFDGTNMWFACQDTTLTSVPARMVYMGLRRFGRDTLTQIPLIRDGKLWLVQDTSGQILIYDSAYTGLDYATQTGRPVLSVDLVSPLYPLISDGNYIWTAETTQGKLIRLQPKLNNPSWLDSVTLPIYSVSQNSVAVDGEIHSIHIVGKNIWVLHTDLSNARSSPNVTVFDKESLKKLAEWHLGIAPTGLFSTQNDVWLGVSATTTGTLYQLDNATPSIVATYDLPHTRFAPWAAIPYGGLLWLTAGAPPVDSAGQFMLDVFVQDTGITKVPGLYSFDPDKKTWGKIYDTLPAPGQAVPDGSIFWYVSYKRPVLTKEGDPTDARVFAVDTSTGQLLGPWSACANPSVPYLAGDFVWLGCYAHDSTLWVISRKTHEVVHKFTSVGTRPWQPLIFENQIWFAFGDSNTAAVFDASTGDLLRVFATGKYPTAPILFNNSVWTYNTGDGTLLHLAFNPSANGEQ